MMKDVNLSITERLYFYSCGIYITITYIPLIRLYPLKLNLCVVLYVIWFWDTTGLIRGH